MDKKEKTKIVNHILGDYLKTKGFEYIGYDVRSWCFNRKFKDIIQSILVNEYGKALRLHLQTNAYLQLPVFDKAFVSPDKYKGNKLGFWEYEDREEFIEILKIYREALEIRGMEEFDKISEHVTDNRPTPETNRYLYENHAELNKKYRLKLGLSLDKIEPVIVANAIQQELERLQNKAFKEVVTDLIGLAAVCGETLIGYFNGEWEWKDNMKLCRAKLPRLGLYPLNLIIQSYNEDTHLVVKEIMDTFEYNKKYS